MKKILSALALGFTLSNVANAQVFTVEYVDNSNDTVVTNGSPAEIKPMIRLNLESGVDSFKYKWQFVEFNMPSDWNASGLCDNVTCHSYLINDTVSNYFKAPFTIQEESAWAYNDTNNINDPSDLIYIWLDIQPEASVGVGVFRYNVISDSVMPVTATPANPQEVEVVHIVRKEQPNSINTIVIPQNAIQLYPNPSNAALNIKIAEGLNVTKAKIIDVQGRVAITTTLNTQTIDIQSLNSGNYVVEFFNEEGIKLTTRKFVKQ